MPGAVTSSRGLRAGELDREEEEAGTVSPVHPVWAECQTGQVMEMQNKHGNFNWNIVK